MKSVKRFFIYLMLVIGLVIGGISFLSYRYQDHLVQHFISQANQVLATPVKIQSIHLSIWKQFPHIAITLEEIQVVGSGNLSDNLLVKAEQLDFTFNLWKLLQHQYTIDQLFLTNGEINLLISKNGNNNYSIFKKNSTSTAANNQLHFKLENIHFNNVQVNYEDQPQHQHYSLLAEDLNSELEVINQQYQINVNGDLLSHFIQTDEDQYLRNKNLAINSQINYDYEKKYLSIDTANIQMGKGRFLVSGILDQMHDNYIDLRIHGQDTDLQTLLSLLPELMVRQFQAYQSEGKVYFTGQIQGSTLSATPLIQLEFGCHQAAFFHPEYRKRLEEVNLQGSFTNGSLHSLQSSVLDLKDMTGTLDGEVISGRLTISNFADHFVRCHIKANLDVNALLDFYPVPEIRSANGRIKTDFSLSGRLKDLRGETSKYWQRVYSEGNINLQNLDVYWQTDRLPVKNMNGNLMFKGNDLTINDLETYIGNSHLVLNGMLRNALAYLLTESQSINIEADLVSQQIDLDELLSGQETSGKEAEDWQSVVDKKPYRFYLDPRLRLDFDCQVKRLKFRRFRARQLQGNLQVANQQAWLRQASVRTAGGKISSSGYLDAQQPKSVKVDARTGLDHLYADSIFYTFEDFGQSFLTAQHLKGKVYADVAWKVNFDQGLRLDYPSLKVDVLATIKEGELNGFDPMQKLSRFVEEESLSQVRFSEMNNHIRIQEEHIYIPRMEVSTNVTKLWIEGVHTFDNQIDYHFQVPMKTFSIRKAAARERARSREEAFGNILNDHSAPLYLFLKAEGTVDDYQIKYDLNSAKQAFQENLQKEKEELKETMQSKGSQPQYQLELEKEEYFDFGDKKTSLKKQP